MGKKDEKATEFHAHRTPGRNCRHRDFGGNVIPGIEPGPSTNLQDFLLEQSEANRLRFLRYANRRNEYFPAPNTVHKELIIKEES